MNNSNPRITIGMPVHNGEKYLCEALDCFLIQTYDDFELIISDNASTDATEEICRTYARRDGRIRYVRNKKNLGAAPNYNQCVELARGKYFKWAAHDDLCDASYLEECVRVLDADSTILVAHSLTTIVDEYGRRKHDYNDLLNFRSDSASERFGHYLFRPASEWNAIFGLMRTAELRKTKLIGDYIASDQTLLGELVLRGKIYQIQKLLFWRRDHPENSWRSSKNNRELAAWFNVDNLQKKLRMPADVRHFIEYVASIKRVDMTLFESVICYAIIVKWGIKCLVWPAQKRWRQWLGRQVEPPPVPISTR